jgi:hypothetical protein
MGAKRFLRHFPLGSVWPTQVMGHRGESFMRSDKVPEALHSLQNRFLLCHIASKAVRSFHKPSTRIQDTMNEVLDKIAGAERRDFLAEQDKKQEPK